MTQVQAGAVGPDGLRIGLGTSATMPFGHAGIGDLVANLTLSGDRAALVDAAGTLTYAQLADRLARASRGLQGLGIGPGAVVAASAANGNDLIIAFLAVQRLGALWAGVNRFLASPEQLAQLDLVRATHLLAEPSVIERLAAARADATWRNCSIGDPDSDFARIVAQAAPAPIGLPQVDVHAPAAIGFTSGTTGDPKAAVHSQHTMMTFVNGCLHGDLGGQWRPGLVRSHPIPLTILNGMIYGPMVALASGGTFVSMDRTDAAGIADWIVRAGVQTINCTPTTVRDWLVKPELANVTLPSLEVVAVGAAPIEDTIRQVFLDRFGFEIVADYGISESPCSMASSRPEHRPPENSVGQAHPFLRIAILDDEGASVANGEVGELCAGPCEDGPWAGVYSAMLGYLHAPAATRATFHGAWLRTGDMARMDEAGNITIVGRRKEMILRGGANVYPAEVERVLNGHPAVAEAVVASLPDARLGEVVAAWVLPKAKHEGGTRLRADLQAYALARLAKYKVPERWFIVDDFPRNSMNKPQKERLRSLACEPL
ncbi:class I adenylate-forming enzyme family protein [Novosphingobium sp. 9U]|uniref:class I adenylate-forming enzyme family protein n=1 Tax=Novosphingobium sp. 9U TaxID=2653158 RepID=UPI00135B7C12|nr:class I adenylate-forming enzyme family protein [Novosphingobium sp. 9U]